MKYFTLEVLEDAVNSMSGFCIECGAEHTACEPDAREYECEECGLRLVYGAEEIILMGLIKTADEDEGLQDGQ